MWHKVLGLALAVFYLLACAHIPTDTSDSAYFIGMCILLAGFMSGAKKEE